MHALIIIALVVVGTYIISMFSHNTAFEKPIEIIIIFGVFLIAGPLFIVVVMVAFILYLWHLLQTRKELPKKYPPYGVPM